MTRHRSSAEFAGCMTHAANPHSVAALAVELADGTVDVLISCEEPASVQVEGDIEFHGQLGLIRLVDGK